jgi:hypothetical protein
MKGKYLVAGIAVILFLYVIPVPVYPTPHPVMGSVLSFSGQQITCPSSYSLTISALAQSVNDPLIIGGLSACSVIVGGQTYGMYQGLFYVGWIIGIICLLYAVSK